MEKSDILISGEGSFIQESNSIMVSDPSYEYNPLEHVKNSVLFKLNLVISKVLKGTWNIFLIVRKDCKTRNAELACVHESVSTDLTSLNWQEEGAIGVDSGQAGVYDLKHFGGNKVGGNQNNSLVIENNKEWYKLNCKIASKPNAYGGPIPNGAVSSSGFGDGMYKVYRVTREDGRVIGIKIVFITDQEIQRWNELVKKTEKKPNRRTKSV